ncbi:hypothetical protein KIH87_11805 [Paraneptunicella aestuarii]|uniref:hypothetical protein n=1 Tax=Paraneptunicella aestuarii TaxID=2831148 RepID=UPI001E644BBC|nr:hypothetical protein [Paraneptunicella aestuarii]UAA37399.1 hypothetical protein KIH87_11805 [Paraneptunicella aestuarii]
MKLFKFKEFEYKGGKRKNRFIVIESDSDSGDTEHFISLNKLRFQENIYFDVLFFRFNEELLDFERDENECRVMENNALADLIEENTFHFLAEPAVRDGKSILTNVAIFLGEISDVVTALKSKQNIETNGEEEQSKEDVYTELKFFSKEELVPQKQENIRKGVDAPYHHIPQVVQNGKLNTVYVNTVGHHTYFEDTFSGTLNCTITCLTPGHFGNYQVPLSQLSSLNISGKESLEPLREYIKNTLLNKQSDSKSLKKAEQAFEKKTISLPNFIEHEEQQLSLIHGSSLMGMLRNNIGALVSAPMQRVAEKTLSYRPNLNVKKLEGLQRNKGAFAATVEDVRYDQQSNEVCEIIVNLYRLNDVKFPEEHEGGYRGFNYAGERLRYLDGIDADRAFTKLFHLANKRKVPLVYDEVYLKGNPILNREISSEEISNYQFVIDDQLIEQFKQTTEHLKDSKHGHIDSHHPHFGNTGKKQKGVTLQSVKDGINAQRNLANWAPNDKGRLLIFVEAEIDKQGNPYNIVSFGNHYRYRWIYKDSVKLLNNSNGQGKLRAELALGEEEAFNSHALPEQLNIMRNMFGDVAQLEQIDNSETSSSSFSKLAGKVSVNHAVEWLGEQNKRRSISDIGLCWAMPRTGTPKANAEHNLIQDEDSPEMNTWGWVNGDEDSQLAGRKFYRHQKHPVSYQVNPEKLQLSKNLSEVYSPTLAYVSPNETQYRSNIRFKGLSRVELGMLLISVQPDLLLKPEISVVLPENVKQYIETVRANSVEGKPVFANKLGYGKPMGLGSVVFNIDRHDLIIIPKKTDSRPFEALGSDDDLSKVIVAAIEYMHRHMLDSKGGSCWGDVLLPWLILHNFQHAEGQIVYPVAEDNKGKTIMKYHGNVRGNQIAQRRVVNGQKPKFISDVLESGESPEYGLLKPHSKLKEALPEKTGK